MTAAPQESDLDLNLVFESAPKPSTASTVAPTKKKRKNKYDRRREKGRLAKLSKQGQSLEDGKGLISDAAVSRGSKGHVVAAGTDDVSGAAAVERDNKERNNHVSRPAQVSEQDASDVPSEEKAVEIAVSKTSGGSIDVTRNDVQVRTSTATTPGASGASAATPSNHLMSSRKNRVSLLSLSNILACVIYITS